MTIFHLTRLGGGSATVIFGTERILWPTQPNHTVQHIDPIGSVATAVLITGGWRARPAVRNV